jgi:fibronectin type 3 domain-containing protein
MKSGGREQEGRLVKPRRNNEMKNSTRKLLKWLPFVVLVMILVRPAFGQAQHGMSLSWTETNNSDPATGFFVFRSTTVGGPYAKLFTTPLPVTTLTYFDSTGVGGTTYYYVITAVDSLGIQSAYSNQISGTAIGSNPNQPTLQGVEQ